MNAIFVYRPCRFVVGIVPKTSPEVFGPLVGLLLGEGLFDYNVAILHEEVYLVSCSDVMISARRITMDLTHQLSACNC